MDYFVGLDVSLRSTAVREFDGDGRTLLECTVACEVDELGERLTDLPAGDLRIEFKASAMNRHLFFGLRAAGFDVVCMESRQVNAALSAMRNKTNKTDARDRQCASVWLVQSCPYDEPGSSRRTGAAQQPQDSPAKVH